MSYRLLLLSGILAVIFYVVAVIIGGALRPGYSHIGNFVSELIETGALNKSLLNPLFILYNLFTGTFAVGLLLFVQAKSPSGSVNLGRAGAIILVVLEGATLTATLRPAAIVLAMTVAVSIVALWRFRFTDEKVWEG